MNRRDILKFFGVGATIAPVLGETAKLDAKALIIEPPKVELIEAPKVLECSTVSPAQSHPLASYPLRSIRMSLLIEDNATRAAWRYPVSDLHLGKQVIDVTSHSSYGWREQIGGLSGEWTAQGYTTPSHYGCNYSKVEDQTVVIWRKF